jgi:HlyD family secretion protein
VNEAKAAFKVAIATEKVQAAALERAAGAVSMARTMKSFAEAQAASATARQDEVERNLQRKLALVRTGSITDRDISQARSERDMGAAEIRAARDQVTLKDEAIAAAEAEQRMSEGSLENARAITEQRQALLDQARLDLERTVIRAPIGGVIIKRNITPGQTVAVSLEAKTLFQIAKDLHQMEVYGRIDEADVGMVKVGQPAAFSVDAFPDRTFAGQVIQIRKAPEVVQSVVTYTALISAPNPDLLLLPGMTASLRIVTKRVENTLYIPNPAIQFSPENADFRPRSSHAGEGHDLARSEAAVWVMQANGMPAPVVIGVGVSDGQRTQVTRGPLQEGDQVIIGQNPR